MKNNVVSKPLNSQDTLACSVCGKEFRTKKVEKYIIAGGCACSWKCFLNEVRRREAERKTEEKGRNNRQIKR